MIDFSALYKKYATDVFGFALYLSGERGEAEDITSETKSAIAKQDRRILIRVYIVCWMQHPCETAF
jgi:DNA-directed RNA polymerase specialized sigma24 family protein